MRTISGVWVFNEILTLPAVEQYLTYFYCNNTLYRTIYAPDSASLGYYDRDGYGRFVYSHGSWREEYYRTIDLEDNEREVSDEFYAWFTANATQDGVVSKPSPYKLTVNFLPGGSGSRLALVKK